MNSKPNVAVIDDENFYLQIWSKFLEETALVKVYSDPDEFIERHLKNFNEFDYIIVDVMFGSINILEIRFSKVLRTHGYDGELILNSNARIARSVLEASQHYDLFLTKDSFYTIYSIQEMLQKRRIDWRKRFGGQFIDRSNSKHI